MVAEPSVKTCNKCGLSKPRSEFHRNSSSKDGLVLSCKPCKSARDSARYQRDTDRIRADARERAATPRVKDKRREWLVSNRESVNARSRAYAASHRDKFRASAKRWREANKEYCNRKKREWEKKNPLARKLGIARYRALQKRLKIGIISRKGLEARIAMFGGLCAYCGAPWEHLDHVKPIARGGAHALCNLRPSCAPCNHTKSDSDPFEWLSKIQKSEALPLP